MRDEPRSLDVLPLHLHQLEQSMPEISVNDIIILARLLRHHLHELESLVELLGRHAVLHCLHFGRYLFVISFFLLRGIVAHENLPQAQHLAEVDLFLLGN